MTVKRFSMKTKVIKGGRSAANGIDKIFIGRPSKFGNPFIIGKDGTREEVLQKFKIYLQTNKELQDAVKLELSGKTLVCYCKPLACHGDIYAELCNGKLPKQEMFIFTPNLIKEED